ncbi:MAG: hypothetical protein MMC33_001976 [Icmadophila ericetorum]|nr:hypothetical protein [Icmadophila ericetorum]
MFEGLAGVLRDAQNSERYINLDHDDEEKLFKFLRTADVTGEDAPRNSEALHILYAALQQMVDKDAQNLSEAAKLLANISRAPTWRLPFGHAGILEVFLRVTTTKASSEDLLLQSLRFIGNACSDTDENRQLVVEGNFLPGMICLLDNRSLESVAVAVIYNICTDYEPAAKTAKANGLCRALIKLLERGSMAQSHLLTNVCQLLDFCMEDFQPDQSLDNAVEVLVQAATVPDLDFDDRVSLVDAAITHLKNEAFQRHMIANNLVEVPINFLVSSYSAHFGSDWLEAGDLAGDSTEKNDQAELQRVRSSLIEVLADVSGLPEFLVVHSGLKSPLIDLLVNLLSMNEWQLQLCSCIVLGNLARSDSTCRYMVYEMKIHEPLLSLLKSSFNTQVLYSVLGFLRNLALLSENKETLRKANTLEAACRFFAVDALPQLSYAAASLVRQMIIGSVQDMKALIFPLDPGSTSSTAAMTRLSALLALFERSDDLAIRTETARIVASVLRSIYSMIGTNTEQEAVASFLTAFYTSHSAVSLPLAMMIYQSKWPAIRSEGWFALALMARSKQGVKGLEHVLKQAEFIRELEGTLDCAAKDPDTSTTSTDLENMLEGTCITESASSPGKSKESALVSKDRENIMVLIHELLKNKDNEAIEVLRGRLNELLRAANS